MNIIDTHCHLYSKKFEQDVHEVIERAQKAGVVRFYLPAIDSNDHGAMLALEEKYEGKCLAMMGLHPCSVNGTVEEELKIVEEWLEKRRFAAVGEIGLDYYWEKTHIEQQKIAFDRQIQWALDLGLPIVIHSRDSTQDCIKMVKERQNGDLSGIFHCFGGTEEEARAIIDLGFSLGIGGVLTYKNSGLVAALEHIPMEHLVLETDSPYLAPVPFRGKRNESAYLTYVVDLLAASKGITREEVANITTYNAIKIFGD